MFVQTLGLLGNLAKDFISKIANKTLAAGGEEEKAHVRDNLRIERFECG